jgi:hypothetical protein
LRKWALKDLANEAVEIESGTDHFLAWRFGEDMPETKCFIAGPSDNWLTVRRHSLKLVNYTNFVGNILPNRGLGIDDRTILWLAACWDISKGSLDWMNIRGWTPILGYVWTKQYCKPKRHNFKWNRVKFTWLPVSTHCIACPVMVFQKRIFKKIDF